MSASREDFLVTHMPFTNLGVTGSGSTTAATSEMSEEDVYQNLIKNPENKHRFIIVKGNNGTGKSHLIRWLQARMENDIKKEEREDEKIVFIRRIDNTLRGAILFYCRCGRCADRATNGSFCQYLLGCA